jgi:hypothetical protein
LQIPNVSGCQRNQAIAKIRQYLDRGYDFELTRERLEERGLLAEISQKGRPAPLGATKR